MPVDVISFGPDREPRHWLPKPRWPDWRGRSRRFRGLVALLVAAVVSAAVAGVLVATPMHARRSVSGAVTGASARPPVLFGVPARGVSADLIIGGDYLWRLDAGHLRQAFSGLLANGLSPLLAGSAAAVIQIEPAEGGVVAVISDTSVPENGRSGVVLFIPGQGPARVIARATAVAVAPGGRSVWVQTAVRPLPADSYTARPGTVWSPTYAVSLAGRRVTPVLRLPLGLVAATGAGLLTVDVETSQLRLWNAVTGVRQQLPLAGSVQVIAVGAGVVMWQPSQCPARCPLRLTDLHAGAAMTIQVPAGWWPTLYQEPVAFDRSGTRFVLPLARTDASGNPVAEDLFLIDITARSFRAIPGGPSASDQPLGLGNPGVQLAASWDRQGRLWVLASSGYGYFQLGYWTGTGPLHVYRPIQGNPAALAAPGTSTS